MRIFKQVIKRSILLALALILVLTPVVYAQTWEYRFPTSLDDTSGVARTYYPALLGYGGTALVDAGKINANGLDTNMQIGSSNIKYMLSTAETGAVIPNYPASGLVTTNFYTGYAPAQTEFPIVIGEGGYITTPDDAALEPANYFEFEQDGYVDTSYTSGDIKNLVYKYDAFKTYVNAASSIRSAVLGAAATPTIAAVNGGNDVVNQLNHIVNLPAGIAVGNLLLVWFVSDGAPQTITFPAGWTLMYGNDYGDHTIAINYRIAALT